MKCQNAGRAGVHQVAAAVAGGEQLFPHAIHPFQHDDLISMPGGRDCRGHSRRAAADDDHLRHVFRLPFPDNYNSNASPWQASV